MRVSYTKEFLKQLSKLSRTPLLTRVKLQMQKVVDNPRVGKPMKEYRKGTREVYVGPYRLSYIHQIDQNRVIFADVYHKDKQ